MKNYAKWTLPFLFAGLLGCADSADEPEPAVEPEFGKTDSLRSVQTQGTILFETTADNAFNEDATFHGYLFQALPGAQVTAEITQAGTSRGLDTTMFIYGGSPGNWTRIAFDDDDGWGPLSKLSKLNLNDYTQYMIVVGTPNGMGRGNYRLGLTCTNDACVDDTPLDLTDCDDDVYDLYDLCVEEMLDNADWDSDDPAERVSVEYCGDDGGVQEYASSYCYSGSTQAYCNVTRDQLQQAVDVCTPKMLSLYNLFEQVELTWLALSADLELEAQMLIDESDGYSSAQLESYNAPDDAETLDIAMTLRENYGHTRDLSIGDVVDRDTYRAGRYLPETTLDAIEAEYGTDYSATKINGSYYVAAAAEEWVTIHVVHYADANVVFAITETSGE